MDFRFDIELLDEVEGKQVRLLAFWDKTSNKPKIVICTHRFLKKDWKVSKQEIDKAIKIMKLYYDTNK